MDTTGPLRPLYICGPTASGKTALSIQLAQSFQGEIVNLDAYQIYRNLSILSAAPSMEELESVPHHLFGVLDPQQEHDAQQHRSMASKIITEIQARDHLPIVVGGSGMYLKFLTHGPSPVPPGDDALRANLEKQSDSELIAQLHELDPKGAEMTNLKNRRYVIRALEICTLSGRPMSSIKTEWKQANIASEKNLRGVLLRWERSALRERIRLRTDHMLHTGVLDEIKTIGNISMTCEKAIGLRDIQSYLAGGIEFSELRDKIFYATCQYAKRQRTWFDKEQWLLHIDPSNLPEKEIMYSQLHLL